MLSTGHTIKNWDCANLRGNKSSAFKAWRRTSSIKIFPEALRCKWPNPHVMKRNDAKLPGYIPSFLHFFIRRRHLHSFIRPAGAISLKKAALRLLFPGTPDATRTHDLLLRRQTLYPTELQAHNRVLSDASAL